MLFISRDNWDKRVMLPTLANRFTISLVTNLFRSGISFATGMLLARWLGPDDYGRMAFLLASFMAFKQLFDMATSSAFFTFLSQRIRSKQFVRYFWYWVGVQFVVSLLLVALFLPESILQIVWKGEEKTLIVLALVATFMQQHVWRIASQMAEASRETIRVQKLSILVTLIHLGVVISLLWLGELTIPLIFIALIVEWSIAGWVAAKMYQQQTKLASGHVVDTPKSVLKEFWHYCLPFIPYAWLGFAHDFADRWMLQHWGGSGEQAYYAVAQQFAAVALLATSSILRIFWKEIAEAQHQGDTAKVEQLYLKVSRGLFFVGAVVAGGLIPWSEEIISVVLGDAYIAGSITLTIMFLYPVHQSMGQIGGAMFYATEKTRVQVILGLTLLIVGLAVVYFMLAPETMTVPGLGLASQGLAIKMVVLQLIGVNIQAYVIARIFGWRYEWFYQLAGLSLVITLGYLAKVVTSPLLSDFVAIQFVTSGLVYLMMISTLIYFLPWLAGLTRKEIVGYYTMMRRDVYRQN
jgi:O-antigen/teichoic acid export membrane protein